MNCFCRYYQTLTMQSLVTWKSIRYCSQLSAINTCIYWTILIMLHLWRTNKKLKMEVHFMGTEEQSYRVIKAFAVDASHLTLYSLSNPFIEYLSEKQSRTSNRYGRIIASCKSKIFFLVASSNEGRCHSNPDFVICVGIR